MCVCDLSTQALEDRLCESHTWLVSWAWRQIQECTVDCYKEVSRHEGMLMVIHCPLFLPQLSRLLSFHWTRAALWRWVSVLGAVVANLAQVIWSSSTGTGLILAYNSALKKQSSPFQDHTAHLRSLSRGLEKVFLKNGSPHPMPDQLPQLVGSSSSNYKNKNKILSTLVHGMCALWWTKLM